MDIESPQKASRSTAPVTTTSGTLVHGHQNVPVASTSATPASGHKTVPVVSSTTSYTDATRCKK